MDQNKKYDVDFLLVKLEEDQWDVVIFGEDAILFSFANIYKAYYLKNSVFDKKPVCVVPDFENKLHGQAWIDYWKNVFNHPEKACKTCKTVNDLFQSIVDYRKSPTTNLEASQE